jgi:glycosyltransferase involved in cell wall biosynthesis
MKIVHVTDYLQTVVGYQDTILPREQGRMGHEVHVITSDRYSPRVYPAHKKLLGENRIKGAGFFIEDGLKVWRLKTLFEASIYPWMLGLEEKVIELKPDIVRAVGIANFTGIRLARLKKRTGGFKLLYDDGMTFDNSKSKLRFLYPLFRWSFSGLIIEAGDALVGRVPETRLFLNKRCGIPPERIDVIPLGADDRIFRRDASARQQVRQELSLNEKDVVFIYTGKITPYKKLELLIDAVKRLLKYENLNVLIVGSGLDNYVAGLRQRVSSAGLEDRFIWRDAVPNTELYKYYSAADVAVWPRGASISQREAMACSLPLIMNEGSPTKELAGYDNGLLFQDDSDRSLAQQMEKLLDSALREEMGANSRKCVEEKYSYRLIARQFIDVVTSKVKPGGPS